MSSRHIESSELSTFPVFQGIEGIDAVQCYRHFRIELVCRATRCRRRCLGVDAPPTAALPLHTAMSSRPAVPAIDVATAIRAEAPRESESTTIGTAMPLAGPLRSPRQLQREEHTESPTTRQPPLSGFSDDRTSVLAVVEARTPLRSPRQLQPRARSDRDDDDDLHGHEPGTGNARLFETNRGNSLLWEETHPDATAHSRPHQMIAELRRAGTPPLRSPHRTGGALSRSPPGTSRVATASNVTRLSAAAALPGSCNVPAAVSPECDDSRQDNVSDPSVDESPPITRQSTQAPHAATGDWGGGVAPTAPFCVVPNGTDGRVARADAGIVPAATSSCINRNALQASQQPSTASAPGRSTWHVGWSVTWCH